MNWTSGKTSCLPIITGESAQRDGSHQTVIMANSTGKTACRDYWNYCNSVSARSSSSGSSSSCGSMAGNFLDLWILDGKLDVPSLQNPTVVTIQNIFLIIVLDFLNPSYNPE